MLLQLNGVVVDADGEYRQEMATFLGTYGVNVVSQVPDPDHLPNLLGRAGGPQLVVVNLDPNPQATLKKLSHLPRQFPQVSFFVMSQGLDAQVLMQSMQAGVREFIPLPVNEENFSAALDRIAMQHGMGRKARLLHFIPTIGGCGSTTVACNTAAALAKSGARTVLLDMDLVRGSVAGYFDIRPRFTIADLMESSEKLDKTLLDNALAIHEKSGLAILGRPDLPEDTQRVKPAGLSRLLNVLSRVFDYVVIDSMMSVDPLYSTVVHLADVNAIVMQLNVPSAKNTERFVGTLRRMAIDSHKIKVTANRFVKKGWDIDPSEVERTLGLQIAHYIPNDFKTAINAINLGEPFALSTPKAEISQSVVALANLLKGKEVRAAA